MIQQKTRHFPSACAKVGTGGSSFRGVVRAVLAVLARSSRGSAWQGENAKGRSVQWMIVNIG